MQTETQIRNKELLREEHKELAEGLLYTHTRINSNTKKNLRINLIPLCSHRTAQRKGIDLDRGTGQAEKSGRRAAGKEVRREWHGTYVSGSGGRQIHVRT